MQKRYSNIGNSVWRQIYVNFLLTLEDKTLEREDEMLDMACVTDILDQNDAVESFDDALQSKLTKL